MLKISVLILASVFFIPQTVAAQILGSGTDSGGTKTTNSKTNSVKNSSKKKSTVAVKVNKPEKTAVAKSNATKSSKAKSTPKNSKSNNSYGKSSGKSTSNPVVKISPTKTQTAQNANRPPENNIIITPSKKTSGSFDELYEQAIDEGNTARDSRSYTNAESAYRKARSLKPNDSRAIYGLGNLFSDQQRWEEAEKAYRQAIVLEPNSPEAYIALSFVLTQPISGASLADRYSEAEKLARKALQLDENNAVGYDQLGVSLELRGVIDGETQDAYRKAIKFDPNFALAYAHLGRLQRRNGLANESAASYRQAVQLANDVPTMILVAEVMQSQQRFTESEQLLRRALREDAKNPTALFLLGRALVTRQSFDEAERVLKTSLEVSPNSFVPYSILASLYQRKGNLDEAEKTLTKATQVASIGEKKQLSQEFSKLGDDFMKIKRNKDAARVYRIALNLDNGNLMLSSKLASAQKS